LLVAEGAGWRTSENGLTINLPEYARQNAIRNPQSNIPTRIGTPSALTQSRLDAATMLASAANPL
jgi:hypothetical protein